MARIKKVDLTNVESFSRCAEGIHTVKLLEITEAVSQNGDDMLKVTFEVTSGADKGCHVFDNFTLIDKALWKFKQFLVAANVKSEGKVAIDLDKLIGKTCDINVVHEEYNGVTRAKISEYTKLVPQKKPDDMADFEDADEDEEVEKPVAKAKPAAKEKPAPKPEADEDWDDDDDDDDDEDDVTPPPAPAKKAKPVAKSAKAAKPAPKKAADDDDDDWEEA